MDAINGFLYGLGVALTFNNLLAALAGALAGTLIGVLPGLGPTAGIAMILPLSYSLDPTSGLIMMAGMFYGAMYGGSTTAILVNMPGESASVITCLDGYKLTKKGRAGAVLTIVAAGSFVGGVLSVVGVMLFAPALAQLGLLFGPAEFFALTAGGLLLFSRISGGSLAAGIFPMAIGLMLSTVGQELVTGQDRFTFGISDLTLGVELVALVVGLYGITEIMSVVAGLQKQVKPLPVRLRDMFPTKEEWKRSVAPYGRGTLLGFVFGLLPGPSATMASFASYRLEKGVSKHKDELGEGAIEGVAGPETANNAAATSSMVPLLALGIPFGSVTALMLAAMMVHGVQPGPMMITQHPEVFWGVIASMLIGNAMLLILNVPLISLWVSLLRVPNHIFLPIILMVATIGCYSVRNSMVDVYMLLLVAFVGYGLTKLNFQLAPMVVGVVLGPLIEKHMREGLFMSLGDISVFYTSPLAVGIWALVILVLLLEPIQHLLARIFGIKFKKIIPESSE
ncbi:MAG: tripartite tricarboxylate transporter permease [Burkholderiaceae bacterium]|jgi:putative tricarboxylic transport membrane protein|nr:tripartite tricarboxylate transporter permease [Burkholderiaceae bacterium]